MKIMGLQKSLWYHLSARAAVCLLGLWLGPQRLGAMEPHAARIDFEHDIIPVLTKLGCNAGACHGAAAGRGGFQLSLYGSQPAADHLAITRQLEGRRINLAHPAASLLLLKPSETLAHGGGQLFEENDASYQLLAQWIAQGAGHASQRRLDQLRVSPTRQQARVGEEIAVHIVAHYADGSQRDVTRWTVLTPEDSSAVSVRGEPQQLLVHRRGRHVIIARYLDRVLPLEILVPLNETTPAAVPHTTSDHFIDREIDASLASLAIPASPPTDEATFRRRVSLHLTGRLPPLESADQPLSREAFIEELLSSEEFIEYWTLQLAKWLRLRAQPNDTQGLATYHSWLSQQVRRGTPLDQLAQQLLLATGDTHTSGPANFYHAAAGPREQAEFVSELFMGTRLRCANCHDHPLDRWTQDDYHGLAAVFARLEVGRQISLREEGEVIHPRTLEAAPPRIPGQAVIAAAGRDPRVALAQWLTAEDNPYFAKALVNRLWKHMMGRGLVEPVDDFRATNPATHPQLLDHLADQFISQGYDLRSCLRSIASSRAYARSSAALAENRDDDRFYSHAHRSPLEPEVLADAIADVLGVAEQYAELPLGTRAVSLIDPQTPSLSLDVLGRCDRKENCQADSQAAGGLPQMLHLFNGDLLNARLSAPGGRLEQLLAGESSAEQIIDEFYRRGLGRSPTQAEADYWQQQLAAAGAAAAAGEPWQRKLLEDFLWSLLTCEEFVSNH